MDSCGSTVTPAASAGTRNWRTLVADARDDEEDGALGARLDPVLHSVDAESGGGRCGSHRRCQRMPRLTRLVDRPGRDELAGHQRFDGGRMPFGVLRVDEPGQHRADRMQRPRSHRPADLLGDQREVADSVPGDAAPAQFLGDQQAGPAELGGASPPVGVERTARGVQFADPAQRGFLLQECLRGRREQQTLGGRNLRHGAGLSRSWCAVRSGRAPAHRACARSCSAP